MYVYQLVPGNPLNAHGGPSVRTMMEDGTYGTPTRAGRFVIYSIGQHISMETRQYSAVPWGAPIRLNAKGWVEVQMGGQWTLLHLLPAWVKGYSSDPLRARLELQATFLNMKEQLKPKYGLGKRDRWPAAWSGALPKTWIFNDFGKTAVKYFVDYNGNRKLDTKAPAGGRKEEVLSDFIHATSYGELALDLDKELTSKADMVLSVSHGCIHLEPVSLRKWVTQGILAVGATLEVHPYTELKVPAYFERRTGQIGKEIHFFPGAQRLALYSVTNKQIGHSLQSHHG